MLTLPSAPTQRLVDGDYRAALLHLAWYFEEGRRFLLFGMVELLPTEMPDPDSGEEASLREISGPEGERRQVAAAQGRAALRQLRAKRAMKKKAPG